MKKNKKKLSFLLMVGTVFILSFVVNCSSEEIVSDNSVSKTESQKSLTNKREQAHDDFAKIHESTNLLSKMIINLGVKEIEKNGDYFSLKTFKAFKIQDKFVNLSEFEFEYSDNILSFKNDKSYKIYSVKNKFYLETPNYNGLLENTTDENVKKDEKLFYLLLFFGEFSDNGNKTDFETVKNDHQRMSNMSGTGCSFWNTYYSVGIGINQAAADANFIHNVKSDILGEYSSHSHCWSLGVPERSNLAHVYYVSQAYCCTG